MNGKRKPAPPKPRVRKASAALSAPGRRVPHAHMKKPGRLTPENPVTEYARDMPSDEGSRGEELHATFEVGVVLRGGMRRQQGAGWFELHRGQAWIVAPLQAHRWEALPGGYTRIVFQVLPSCMERLPSIGEYDLMRPFLTAARRGPIGSSARFRKQLTQLADELYAARPANGIVDHGQALFDLLRLLPLIAQHVRETTPRTEPPIGLPRREYSVYPAMELVERHADRTIGLDEAAQSCGMGRTLFTTTFRTCMGISFARFQLRSRLALSAEALRHTDLPIKAIAARFGFTDTSHFNKCFARHYGTTPAHYRRTHMGSVSPLQ